MPGLMKWGLIAVVGVAVFLVIAGRLGLLRGSRPTDLGPVTGAETLRPLPASPNAVSSQVPRDSESHIDPFRVDGDPHAAFIRLKAVMDGWPRATLVTENPRYLHYEVETRLMRFVDDVEFLLSPKENIIHVRSGSRLGKKDFGVNRDRVEKIREAFFKGSDPAP